MSVHNRDRHEWHEPIGWIYNPSDDPNCYITTDRGDRTLYIIKIIFAGEEMTVFTDLKVMME